MMKQEIILNNKLIAKFMGKILRDPEFDQYKDAQRLKYHNDWSQLMSVVEKIMQTKFEDGENTYLRTFGMLNAETGKPMVRFNRYQVFEDDTLIEATYAAVVDYIETYYQE